MVKNDKGEFLTTRFQSGWRARIDYRKLNSATKKDHFPLPFLDQMFSIFFDLVVQCLQIFVDDFTVYEGSFEDCVANLEKVLRRCRDKKLTLNLDKCHFMLKKGIA